MRLEHIAIWTDKLDALKDFYTRYFNGTTNALYHNPAHGFSSYFISFPGSGSARLELMHMPGIPRSQDSTLTQFSGFIHICFDVGTPAAVDALTARIGADGYLVLQQPRTTGDGYYESVVLDPDGNRVEIGVKLEGE